MTPGQLLLWPRVDVALGSAAGEERGKSKTKNLAMRRASEKMEAWLSEGFTSAWNSNQHLRHSIARYHSDATLELGFTRLSD